MARWKTGKLEKKKKNGKLENWKSGKLDDWRRNINKTLQMIMQAATAAKLCYSSNRRPHIDTCYCHCKLESWKTGNLENWKTGKLEIWKSGKLEIWKTGKLENWKTGKLESWTTGKLENWKAWQTGKVENL